MGSAAVCGCAAGSTSEMGGAAVAVAIASGVSVGLAVAATVAVAGLVCVGVAVGSGSAREVAQATDVTLSASTVSTVLITVSLKRRRGGRSSCALRGVPWAGLAGTSALGAVLIAGPTRKTASRRGCYERSVVGAGASFTNEVAFGCAEAMVVYDPGSSPSLLI